MQRRPYSAPACGVRPGRVADGTLTRRSPHQCPRPPNLSQNEISRAAVPESSRLRCPSPAPGFNASRTAVPGFSVGIWRRDVAPKREGGRERERERKTERERIPRALSERLQRKSNTPTAFWARWPPILVNAVVFWPPGSRAQQLMHLRRAGRVRPQNAVGATLFSLGQNRPRQRGFECS